MALTSGELEKIKRHLGYSNLTLGALPYVGDVPVNTFIVMRDSLSLEGEKEIRDNILPRLDQLEADLYTQRSRRKASKVGSIVLNQNEIADLLSTRDFFLARLETVTGIKRRDVRGGNTIEVY